MNKNDWSQILRAAGLITQIGIVMIVNIGVGFLLGYLIDNFFGYQLTFKLTGLIIGIGSGFYSDYRLIKSIVTDEENENNINIDDNNDRA